MVRKLWTWPDHYPRERLLTPEDFVTWRVDWNDKAGNIREIAAELGFATDAFLFVDDHPSSASAFAASCRKWRSGARSYFRCAGSS